MKGGAISPVVMPMLARHLRQNYFLAGLMEDEMLRLQSRLELMPMTFMQVLYSIGGDLGYVYFPTRSILSMIYTMKDGLSSEIAVVGNEGVIGIPIFMGGVGSRAKRSCCEQTMAIGSGSKFCLKGAINENVKSLLQRTVRRVEMNLGTILLIIVILLLVGAIPTWPHSQSWGYAPSGGLGLVLLILLILWLMGKI